MREKVVALQPKSEPAMTAPAEPQIDVRAVLSQIAQAATQHAAQAAAAATKGAATGVLLAVGAMLAQRLLLLAALVGGFVLAIVALQIGSYQALGVLIAYAVLIMIPLVWLERASRPTPPGS